MLHRQGRLCQWKRIRDMRITTLLLLLLSLLHSDGRSCLAQSTMTAPPIQPQEMILLDDANLNAICCVGPDICYVVGNRGVIRRTSNGGHSWDFIPAPVACDWHAVQFITDNIGWIAGGVVAAEGQTTQGCLIFTRDGGQTWTVQAPPEMGFLRSIQFFDLEQGIVCGEGSNSAPSGIWMTDDGGQHWQAVTASERMSWLHGQFTSPQSGVVVGERGKVGLLGGQKLLLDPSVNVGSSAWRSVVLDQNGAGWLVGERGGLRYSPAGASWQDAPQELPQPLDLVCDFRSVHARGQQVWIVGHPGRAIISSADGGQNWQILPSPTFAPLNAIHFADEQVGYAVGDLGTILKTDDAGQSWQVCHGPARRLALLQLTTLPTEASFALTARYAGHQGYRTGLIALCAAPDPGEQWQTVSERLSLQAAQQWMAGNLTDCQGILPLDYPEIRYHQSDLLERWQQATDGQLTDVVLKKLVRDLRTYRPSVLVVDEPTSNDAAGQLLLQAVQTAVRLAGEPHAMTDLEQMLNLPAWKVNRLLLRNRSGQGGDLLLDNNNYLSGLEQSVRSASGAAYRLINSGNSFGPLFESYSVAKITPLPANMQLHDAFTGIVLGPDSEARRRLLPRRDSDQQGEELARRQRNLSAYVKTQLQNEAQAGQTIAQLLEMVQGMNPEQATMQLYEVALEYRKDHRWDYYEAVLMEIVAHYPQHPLAHRSAVELIQLWSSQEMQRIRLSDRGVRANQLKFDTSQVPEQIRQTGNVSNQTTPTGKIPDVITSDLETPVTAGSQQEIQSWLETWRQRTLDMYESLEQRAPHFAVSPEVRLPLASQYRTQGASRAAHDFYQLFLQSLPEDNLASTKLNPLQTIAATEFWFRTRQGIPPGKYLVCRRTELPPYLDGDLSDQCWELAEEIRLKTTVGAPELKNVTAEQTPVVLCSHDDDYFYLAASCPRWPGQPFDPPAQGERRYDMDLEGYDRLLISLDVDRDYLTAYQFEIDQRGYTRDRCGEDWSWNPEWYVAAAGDEHHWRIELAIPRDQLEWTWNRTDETTWAVGITRILPAKGIQSWADQQSETYHLGSAGWVTLEK